MKKIISTILALAMVSVLSVTAFAAEGDTVIKNDTLDKSGTTAISHTVDPFYIVTIPASVTLGGTETISASDVIVDEGKQVNVKLTATSGKSQTDFTVKTDRGAELTYAVTKEQTVIGIGDTVLSVNPTTGTTGTAVLKFSEPTNIQFSGTYKGTVTFTVSVDNLA